MKIYRTYFGKKLKSARELRGITQAQFSEILDVKPSTISRWESGHDFPSDERLPRILKALGIPESYFDVNQSAKNLSFSEAAEFLATFAKRPPQLQRLVMALVFADPSLVDEPMPVAFQQALRNALKE